MLVVVPTLTRNQCHCRLWSLCVAHFGMPCRILALHSMAACKSERETTQATPSASVRSRSGQQNASKVSLACAARYWNLKGVLHISPIFEFVSRWVRNPSRVRAIACEVSQFGSV